MFILGAGINYTNAQDGKYGKDSVNCVRNLSLYKEYLKQKAYHDALKPWITVFSDCPASSKNIYLDGQILYTTFIENEKDKSRISQMVDTLLLNYDRRIQYFGQEGFVLGRKGVDLLRYRREEVETAYSYLSASIKDRLNASEEAVVVTYMQTTAYLFSTQKLTREDVLNNFAQSMTILQSKLDNAGETDKIDKIKSAIEAVETHFSKSGAADCSALIKFFTPKFQQTPEDLDLLKKMTDLLDKAGCNDDDLFLNASINLYKLEPSARAAYMLAKMFVKRKDVSKALHYYNQAVNTDTVKLQKAQYYLEMAAVFLSQNEPEKARSNAQKCLEIDKGKGMAHIIIGKAYSSSINSCGTNDFEKAAVYWVVVDKFIQAKNADGSVAEEANQLISSYSKSFPNREEAFFYGVNEGDAYTVGCWISEKTKARFR
jgi:tetratricopeptide (TPR) repeat protein